VAIDTEEKRRSALAFNRRGYTLPVATGAPFQGARQHLLGAYSGILATAPTIITLAISVQTKGVSVLQISVQGVSVTEVRA